MILLNFYDSERNRHLKQQEYTYNYKYLNL